MNKPADILNFETWSLDRDNWELINQDKRRSELTEKEFGLLDLLITRAGNFVSKKKIGEKVWQQPSVDPRAVEQVVKRLRRKLKMLGLDAKRLIEQKSGLGYRFPLNMSRADSQSQLIAVPEPHRRIVTHNSHATRIGFTANAVQAFDHANRLMWTHVFSNAVDPYYLERPKMLADLVRFISIAETKEQYVVIAVPLRVEPNPSQIAVTQIDCFAAGSLVWSYVPNVTFWFQKRHVVGRWIVEDIFVSIRERPRVFVVFAHYRWGYSFIAEIDLLTGKDSIRFVNTGTIYKVNEILIEGRSNFLIGGFNNEYRAGALAVFDQSKAFAASPQTEGSEFECVSCAKGAPDYYFVFPRSEINEASNLWEDSVRYIYVNQDEFDVEKPALADPVQGDNAIIETVHIAYEFRTRPVVKPFSFRFDSRYDFTHRDLEQTGVLDHNLQMCPERLSPKPVMVWTPTKGWDEIPLEPMKEGHRL